MAIDRDKFWAKARTSPIFNGKVKQSQVDGINDIIDAWEKYAPGSDLRFIAYSLGTAAVETAFTFQPIDEKGGNAYFEKNYGIKGSNPRRARLMGNTTLGYGALYHGRGYVQLTWYNNYLTATKKLQAIGLLKPTEDMIKTPDLALRPDVAAAVMVFGFLGGWWTGAKIGKFFKGNISHWVDARTCVNGLDRAAEIAGYALFFYGALTA